MPAILANWEAKVKKIMAPDQPGTFLKSWVWWCVPVTPIIQEV
jgi:hypothetical protein